MKLAPKITIVVLVLLVSESSGWLWRRGCGSWIKYRPCTANKCSDPARGKPFYFGTTNLSCIKKGRRDDSPSRPTLELSHRWIYYDGYYFERLSGKDTYNKGFSTDMNRCSTKMEGTPAGYSSLSIDCLQRCTDRYRQQFGSYNLLSNNCHDFANRFSDMLCSETTCPEWCGTA